jgi:hypothetical protein
MSAVESFSEYRSIRAKSAFAPIANVGPKASSPWRCTFQDITKARKRLTPRPQLENAPAAALLTGLGVGELSA